MVYQNLPSETKLHIASHCTPHELFSLALVASDLQPEAEEMLYSSIAVNSNRFESLQRAFKTLSENPQKAGFVKFLSVEVIDLPGPQKPQIVRRFLTLKGMVDLDSPSHEKPSTVKTSRNYIAAQALLAVLPKLTSLTDLRMKFHNRSSELEESLSLSSQMIRPLQDLRRESPVMPLSCVVGMGLDNLPNLSLFPAFQTPGRGGMPCRILKPAIDGDPSTHVSGPLNCNSVEDVCLYFETLEDAEYVSRCILDTSQCFSNVKCLTLCVQRAFKLVSTDISTIIAPLRNLEELNFKLYSATGGFKSHDVIEEAQLAYAREWEG
ncbi:hypothetical protein H0H92_014112 [Tricholoma furcatifolium]|nr:hypothetical protein H0H92_014112 [Tricholoma furcatifolium]